MGEWSCLSSHDGNKAAREAKLRDSRSLIAAVIPRCQSIDRRDRAWRAFGCDPAMSGREAVDICRKPGRPLLFDQRGKHGPLGTKVYATRRPKI